MENNDIRTSSPSNVSPLITLQHNQQQQLKEPHSTTLYFEQSYQAKSLLIPSYSTFTMVSRGTIALDVIAIVFYLPALLVALYVGLKHGFSRSAGWFQLILLALFRLTGSSLSIAAQYQQNTGVWAAALIFSGIGTVSLVGALLGLIGRVNEALKEKAFPPRFARYIQLLTIVAIVLAAVGGNYAFSSNADTRSEGYTLSKAAIILILVIYLIAGAMSVHSFIVRSLVPRSDQRLLHVCLISLPFILVRLVYAICGTFLRNSNTFGMLSTTNSAIIVRAIMGLLMEFIVVALFLWAGCTVDRSAQREAERANRHAANGSYQSGNGLVQELSVPASKQHNSSV